MFQVSTYIASGVLRWYETCAVAVGATAKLYDEDIDPDDLMGQGTTGNDGAYSIRAPLTDVSCLVSLSFEVCCTRHFPS
jgi:hypothetical protein